MRKKNGGFTIIEMAVVLVVAAILLDVAVTASVPAFDRMSVTTARSSFAALHARARARAVERGSNVRLFVDPSSDRAWIFDGTGVVEVVAFGSGSGIDVTASETIELCLSPRGYADTDCNSFTSAMEVGFARGGERSSLELRPLGQIVMED
jgi:prepilin-type N-terminal cleavage/methylation domain-containing protein